jgi:hypothetical protein
MSTLADLAREIEELARQHPDYSRVIEAIRCCCDHLRAVERISRLQRELLRLRGDIT